MRRIVLHRRQLAGPSVEQIHGAERDEVPLTWRIVLTAELPDTVGSDNHA